MLLLVESDGADEALPCEGFRRWVRAQWLRTGSCCEGLGTGLSASLRSIGPCLSFVHVSGCKTRAHPLSIQVVRSSELPGFEFFHPALLARSRPLCVGSPCFMEGSSGPCRLLSLASSGPCRLLSGILSDQAEVPLVPTQQPPISQTGPGATPAQVSPFGKPQLDGGHPLRPSRAKVVTGELSPSLRASASDSCALPAMGQSCRVGARSLALAFDLLPYPYSRATSIYSSDL